MLVMSMLNIVGAARLRINFGMGVSVILRNCSALRSAFAMKKPRFLFDTIFTKKKKYSSPVYRRNCFVSTNSLPGLLQQKTALPGGRAVLGHGKEAEYYRVLQNSFR